ncbi:molybdopterin-dependent oxidoreductase [Paludisphaera borealis]|uniref:Sulfoxide reductase catalytic subunit YedY n=1 Tax=Paludisphaera borealis TaxID=1387353 RepID=A0A1U7CM19_9BACT|nr:molybdopterin-dependent oxidoreductase [Paludisphaera borealis]APW59923.1 Sulfoxide reductase catalytic subunit YedY [Paludisphaera borealis]
MRIRRDTLLVFIALVVAPTVAAYAQWAAFGLPSVAAETSAPPDVDMPTGFPAWLRIHHYVNLFFLIILIRSGLQILADHPRLYWNVHCTPGTEWLRATPIEVPTDRVWTSKNDSRHLSPWIGLPGYRHTVGMARHWHFLSVLFWVGNGLIFVILLFGTGQWRRLVPTSWRIVPEAWSIFVHYATLHMPPEPNGFYRYNALQQLAYFSTIFVLAPLAIATGPSMSPAFTNRFSWYPRLPGNRQIGRSLHFLVMVAFLGFLVVHVAMVSFTGLVRNMNHIVIGTDDGRRLGIYLGLLGIVVVAAFNGLANWAAWRRPRTIQHIARAIVTPIMKRLLNDAAPEAEFPRDQISPFFWPNGKLPTSDEWTTLNADDFKDYRLKISGLIENPVELSLDEIRAMGVKSQVTLHHCIQGWSGVAAWRGTPMSKLIDLVRPTSDARMAVFHSFGEGLEGGLYYDSHAIENLRHPQSILAYEMNDEPLSALHGAPLRLRVENQLGFKMVKWIRAIEFVESHKDFGEGEGGYNEDHEYFGEQANI